MTPTVLKKPTFREIDVARFIAVVAMIVNHAMTEFTVPESSRPVANDWLFFLGSFAPVLFFFLTGLGAGIGGSKREARWCWPRSVAIQRAAVLFAADAFLWLSSQQWRGFDFFAFIGVAALTCELMSSLPSRRSRAVAAACVFLSGFLVRFVWGRNGGPLSFENPVGVLEAVTWIAGGRQAGISYPFTPWICFPAIGYFLGLWLGRSPSSLSDHRWKIVGAALTAAVMGAAMAQGLVLAGRPMSRWGSMTLSYFMASWSSIGCCVALSLSLTRLPRGTQFLKLPGLTSFAVVPIHYGVLAYFPAHLGRGFPYASIACVTLLSLSLAKLFTSLTFKLTSSVPTWPLFAVNAACSAGSLYWLATSHSQASAIDLRVLGQLSLLLMLTLIRTKRDSTHSVDRAVLRASREGSSSNSDVKPQDGPIRQGLEGRREPEPGLAK